MILIAKDSEAKQIITEGGSAPVTHAVINHGIIGVWYGIKYDGQLFSNLDIGIVSVDDNFVYARPITPGE